MRIHVHNLDRMEPTSLLLSVGEYHYFADTRMSLRCGRYDPESYRVHLARIDRAFDPKALVEKFTLDFAETPTEKLAEAFDELLGRFPRAIELHASLAAQKWVFNEEDRTFDAYRTPAGVLLLKSQRPAARVWSPFARLAPVEGRPETWTKELLVRAAHNGQYSRVSAHTCVASGGAMAETAARPMDGVGGLEFARILLEDDYYQAWKIFSEGEVVVAEGTINAERTDRFELVPDYL